ncbi:hypothetical protein HanIR_Chr09g0449811 [Helianthus annuus]|nr:hypothetical protein HanIR_Chr09g0449811 [Helianthus annuus]
MHHLILCTTIYCIWWFTHAMSTFHSHTAFQISSLIHSPLNSKYCINLSSNESQKTN